MSGYGTEYSGMRFGMFFLNEYAGMTIMSMVAVTLFLGGWHGPFEDLVVVGGVAVVPFIWFMLKTYALVFALVWVRLSLPRLQVDQLMAFAWKILIPLGLLNIAAHGRGHPLGAALEVGPADLRLGGARRLRRPLRPHPQVAPSQTASSVCRW